MGKWLKKFSESVNQFKGKLGKKSQLVLAGILAIVMLIIFFKGVSSTASSKETENRENETKIQSGDYVEVLEMRLENILSSIDGVGKVKTFVMTETSVRTIFAGNEEVKSSTDGTSSTESQTTEIIFSKDGSSSTPVSSVEIYPEVVGVLIVAEGVDDEKLRVLMINAVAVALNIENSKIEVLSGKGE